MAIGLGRGEAGEADDCQENLAPCGVIGWTEVYLVELG